MQFQTYLDLNKNELRNARVQNLSTAPSSPVTGQIYYDTDDNKLYIWNGTAWESSGGTIPDASTTVKGIVELSLADGSESGGGRAVQDSDVRLTNSRPPNGTAGGVLAGSYPNPSFAADMATQAELDAVVAAIAETVRDTIGTALVAGNNIDVTVNDAGDTITIDVETLTSADISDITEAVQDLVGGMVTGNSESGVTVTYDDTGGKLDFAFAADMATQAELDAHINDTTAAHAASSISYAGGTGMSATDVEAAIDELANEKADLTYVDGLAQGVAFKESVRVASTANVTIASALVNGGTLDGITLATGDRALLKDQTAGAENGIYIVAASGAASRATDADSLADLESMATFVDEGTVNANTGWHLLTDNFTLGTTPLVYTKFSGLGEITAGGGIGKSGETLSVAAGTGITQDTDGVSIDTAVVVRKYATGCAAATSTTVTHNLGTRDVQVTVYLNSGTYEEVMCDVEHTDTNTVTVRFAVAPAANAYRIVVQA